MIGKKIPLACRESKPKVPELTSKQKIQAGT
jgi:hypothetical protein